MLRMDFFRVERVEISGVQLLAPHEVLAASGVGAGQNVWQDPAPWIAALRAHPVVAEATVERSLPRTLLIHIEERRPVALLEAGTLRPATAEGELLPVDPARVPLDLPLVRGAPIAGDAARVEDPDIRLLLVEMGRLARLDPALLARISEIRRAPSGDLLLTLGHPAAELLLPAGSDPLRLRQVRAVLADLDGRGSVAADPRAAPPRVRVDARFADQVVVRFPAL
jgi:cell division protein FtsQ